jgi:copper chaperone NosL
MTSSRAAIAGVWLLAAACGGGAAPPPAAWESGSYACSFCRMMVVDRSFASQLLVPYEDPRFFDDMGCLASYLKNHPELPPTAVVYVADRRTGEWILARDAVYTSVPGLTAPMGSHIVAHATAASRSDDPQAAGGVPVAIGEVFPSGWPGGRP